MCYIRFSVSSSLKRKLFAELSSDDDKDDDDDDDDDDDELVRTF